MLRTASRELRGQQKAIGPRPLATTAATTAVTLLNRLQNRRSVPMNLSIPEVAAVLSVSETRLRKTLSEIVVPTLIEFRGTRTGVRKTTVLDVDAIDLLRSHFEAPLPCAVP